jgi:hypothetical protein
VSLCGCVPKCFLSPSHPHPLSSQSFGSDARQTGQLARSGGRGICAGHAHEQWILPCAINTYPARATQTRCQRMHRPASTCTRRMRRTCCSPDGCQQALGAVLDLLTLLRHAVADGPPQVDPCEGESPGHRLVLDRELVRGPLIPQACGGIRHSRSSFARCSSNDSPKFFSVGNQERT